jgi:hypothetical protein
MSNLGDGTVPKEGGQIKGLDAEYEVVAEHGSIPANADAQRILTDIRKQINNEKVRSELVEKMTEFAEDNLPKARPRSGLAATGDSMLDMARALAMLFMRGTPDPEKIKLRDEIKDMASKLVRNARANITIEKGVEKDASGEDMPEHLYISVADYEVQDSGTGEISNATMTITVDSLATFEEALSNTGSLAAAYQSRKIIVEGRGGILNTLNGKIAKWISKYVRISGF